MAEITWAIGVPGSGKTTLALAEARALAMKTRRPLLLLDTERALPISSGARVSSVRELVESLWGAGKTTIYTPALESDRERVLEVLAAAGSAVVLIDEASAWITARSSADDPLLRLFRLHRHLRLAFVLTTQHLSGDIPQAAFSCAPRLCVFRCTSGAALDRIERDFGLDRGEVSTLPQFHYLETTLGFS